MVELLLAELGKCDIPVAAPALATTPLAVKVPRVPVKVPATPVRTPKPPKASASSTVVANSDPNTVVITTATATTVQSTLKTMFSEVIQALKKHYIFARGTTIKVNTSQPFVKSVDLTRFPDYAAVVPHQMNLVAMERKVTGGKYFPSTASATASGAGVPGTYAQGIDLFREDMALIRSNAYAYNTGIAGSDIQIMVDALKDYFEYLLKNKLLKLQTDAVYGIGHKSNKTAVQVYNSIMYTRSTSDSDSMKITKKSKVASEIKYVESTDNGGQELLMNKLLLDYIQSNNAVKDIPSSVLAYLKSENLPIQGTDAVENAIPPSEPSPIASRVATPVDVVPIPVVPVQAPIVAKKSTKKVQKKDRSSPAMAKADDSTVLSISASLCDANTAVTTYVDPAFPHERVKEEWEIACDRVWNKIIKHDYVDGNKVTTCVLNFFCPIVDESVM